MYNTTKCQDTTGITKKEKIIRDQIILSDFLLSFLLCKKKELLLLNYLIILYDTINFAKYSITPKIVHCISYHIAFILYYIFYYF